MKFAVLHSTNVRDSFSFNEDDDGVYGPTQVRKAIATYKSLPVNELSVENVSGYRLADIVDVAGLEDVFGATQNIAKAWKKGERSTSVGDVIIRMNDDYSYNAAFVVGGFGFCQLAGA